MCNRATTWACIYGTPVSSVSAGARCLSAVNKEAVQTGRPTSPHPARCSLCTRPTAPCSASPSPLSPPRVPETLCTLNESGHVGAERTQSFRSVFDNYNKSIASDKSSGDVYFYIRFTLLLCDTFWFDGCVCDSLKGMFSSFLQFSPLYLLHKTNYLIATMYVMLISESNTKLFIFKWFFFYIFHTTGIKITLYK